MIYPRFQTGNSNKLYSMIANFYDIGLWLVGYKLGVRYFISLLPQEKSGNLFVLDAGCGTGLYSFAVLDRFPQAHVTAFDLNKDMITRLNRSVQKKGLENRIKVSIGDVTKPIPQIREQFDVIITGGVLEYVDDIASAVKNLSLYLKSGGYFLNSPVRDNWLAKIVARLFRFKPHSREANINAFISNGYKLESLPFIKTAHLFKKI
jgi:SAM-dependent methyltransferase